jgi:hypothetical protein
LNLEELATLGETFQQFLSEGADTGSWGAEKPPRPLPGDETQIIPALLDVPFPGRDKLRAQLPSVKPLTTA